MRKSLRMLGLIISFSMMLAMGYSQISFKLTPDHSKVFASEDGSLFLAIKNSGGKSLSNVLVSITMPKELGGQRNFTVASIPSGSTYTKTIDIATYDTTPLGNYSVNSTVAYGGEIIDYPEVTVEVVNFPLTIGYQLKKDSMNAGEENSLMVTARNEADDPLNNFDISIDYPGGFITNMSRTLYLPQVASRLELRQEFTFIAPADANGDYHIGINIAFKDANGNIHTLQEYAKVDVKGSAGLGWLETLLVIVIVILIGLILLGRAK